MDNSLTTPFTLDVSILTVHPSFSSLPTHKMKESTSSKYHFFYEITHVPEANKVKDSHLPLFNPYKAFKRSFSFSSTVKKIVSPKFQAPKEYILSTELTSVYYLLVHKNTSLR